MLQKKDPPIKKSATMVQLNQLTNNSKQRRVDELWAIVRKAYGPGSLIMRLKKQQLKELDDEDIDEGTKSLALERILIVEEVKTKEDGSSFLDCWVHHMSNVYITWEIFFIISFVVNM